METFDDDSSFKQISSRLDYLEKWYEVASEYSAVWTKIDNI